MPNSCEINSFVTGVKNMSIITELICYDKLFIFSSTRISTARLPGFCAIELKNTLEEIFLYEFQILLNWLRNFLLTLPNKTTAIQKWIASSSSHTEAAVIPVSNNRVTQGSWTSLGDFNHFGYQEVSSQFS